MRSNWKRKRQLQIYRRIGTGVILVVFAWLAILPSVKDANRGTLPTEGAELEVGVTNDPTPMVTEGIIIEEVTTEPEPTEAIEDELPEYGDPNNYIYPYNTMSADWGSELYESGFKFFDIPQKYKDEGGCFPEVVQAYLWCLCEEKGIDYYMVVALIERESHYKYTALGDDGNSLGYMQIYQKWHLDRMDAEGVTDLREPYGNIRVGLNFLEEIQSRYLDSSGKNCVLMVYNMGESTAKRLWSEGIYSSEYSRSILQRAQEIKQELQE